MKAVSYSATGDSDVLTLGEREEPHPGAGEVRVRIHVSGVNPTDWKARRGSGPAELPRPQVPNQDGAGVVDEVGDGVTRVRVGDRVWVWDAAYQRPDGTAQVRYRGANWTVTHLPGVAPATGLHRVREIVGNRLVVEKL